MRIRRRTKELKFISLLLVLVYCAASAEMALGYPWPCQARRLGNHLLTCLTSYKTQSLCILYPWVLACIMRTAEDRTVSTLLLPQRTPTTISSFLNLIHHIVFICTHPFSLHWYKMENISYGARLSTLVWESEVIIAYSGVCLSLSTHIWPHPCQSTTSAYRCYQQSTCWLNC